MNYLKLFLLLSIFSKSFAQDTLILKTGEILPVKIFFIDEKNGLIGFVNKQDTLFRSIVTLSEYKVHSQLDEESVSTMNEGRYYPSQNIVRRPVSKYSYSPYSIGFNPLSLFPDFRETSIAGNQILSIYGEYKKNASLGLRIPVKIGLGTEQVYEISDELWWIQSYRRNYTQLIYEIGIEPIFYLNKNSDMIHSIIPGIYIGANHGMKEERYFTYWTDGAGNSQQGHDKTILSTDDQRTYFRFGLNYGFHINLSKRIQIGTDMGIYYGKVQQTSNVTFDRANSNSTYILNSNESFNTYRRIVNAQLSFNLVYRFGGTKNPN